MRRIVSAWVPHAGFQKLRLICDTIHESSVRIFSEKKAAVERAAGGDSAALKEQLVEGKDIMTILSECPLLDLC